MGIKDWFAKKAGPSSYGDAFGRQIVENGIAFGRVLYWSHGIRRDGSGAFVFEDEQAMRAAGFTLYCPDPLNRPANEDSSELSRQTRIAGLAFAAACAIAAAGNFMKPPNANAFKRSLGDSVRNKLHQLGLPLSSDDVIRYSRLPRPEETNRVLNLDEPGRGDLLFVMLEEVSRASGNGAVAFIRTGVTGFDILAVPLASETVQVIRETSDKFGW
jgi:hypothetical protein